MMPRLSRRLRHRRDSRGRGSAACRAALEPTAGQRLEPDEQTAQPGARGLLDQIAAQDRINRRGALEDAAHAAHAVEQIAARNEDYRSR